MPVYNISVTDCVIRAESEEKARFAFANYVAGDLGIECFKVKQLDESKIDDNEIDYEG